MNAALSSGRRIATLLQGLTFKQAAVTLLVVLVLGLTVSAYELYAEWQALRAEVHERMTRTLALVEGPAAEAAYQLHPELSRRLVDGLFAYDAVNAVRLSDNFGEVLARRGSVAEPTGFGADLFDDIIDYRLALTYEGPGDAREAVGSLEVRLSAAAIAGRFRDRVLLGGTLGLVRAVAISAVVVAVFYFMITRPLLRLAGAIGAVDPAHPGAWPAPRLPGHERDELGLLARSLKQLLEAFQRGLDQRDAAEGELRALTGELEQRVERRTAELAREKEQVEWAYTQLDHTHRELEQTNRLLLESIQYARRIQSAMLPDKGALGGAVRDIHVCWEPLHVVGGDWFWLQRFGDRSLLLIADCTGHGVPGAFITLVVASALDRILNDEPGLAPSAILARLDEAVRSRLRQDHPDADSDDGLDAAVCVWDAAAASVTFAGANLPLLYHEAGQVETLKGDRASLGYASLPPARAFTDHVVAVRPGMSFYLLTDGVPDQMGGEPPQLLGRRRLARVIAANAGLPMHEQLLRLEQALAEYRGDEPRRDDMTLIGFTPL